MSSQIEFMIGKKARVVMSDTTFKEKPYWSIAKHKREEEGSEWRYGPQTILVGKDMGGEFAEALRAFADMIDEEFNPGV